jgi:selenocysteine-specific elongation factor
MATVVVGTAGHIDHGKTTLLRALTGIDADRLPEERARGMTIDVGFAHLVLDDGSAIDFVDVPGHDRLVGNMLVGAGEVDGVLLVVAADDGPRAQTLEHLELLDALGIRRAVVAITKADAVEADRVAEVGAAVRALLDRTSMVGAPIVAVSGLTADGLPMLRERLVELRNGLLEHAGALVAGPVRLPIDRAFTIRGRGSVVTGTLRGSAVTAGDTLRVEPGGPRAARVREVQVHHGRADRGHGGRTALNLSGVAARDLRRGQVLTSGLGVEGTDRLLVDLRPPVALRSPVALRGAVEPAPWPPAPRADLRLHLWTESADASVGPPGARWLSLDEGAVAATLRLARPIAALVGARAVLRDPGSGRVVAGVTILDLHPPRGISRRRVTADRIAALAEAVEASGRGGPAAAIDDALLDLHGLRRGELARDVREALSRTAVARAGGGTSRATLRAELMRALRALAAVDRAAGPAASAAIDRLLADLVASGSLAHDGDRVTDPAHVTAAGVTALAAAMDRLEALLDAAVPPALSAAARAAGCPPEGLRALEAAGRIVRVEDDLAWAAARYATLRDLAIEMARPGPLVPAAFRDAVGGNRRATLALLEDLGRRGILRRTEAGHVLGPRAGR